MSWARGPGAKANQSHHIHQLPFLCLLWDCALVWCRPGGTQGPPGRTVGFLPRDCIGYTVGHPAGVRRVGVGRPAGWTCWSPCGVAGAAPCAQHCGLGKRVLVL